MKLRNDTYLWRLFVLLLLMQGLGACQQKKATAAPQGGYSTKAAHPDGTGKVYLGREIAHVMSASGGPWLDRSNRQLEEDVNTAIRLMKLRPDMVVADIGAGTGYYTFRMAELVPQGRVFAVEVQPEFVEALKLRRLERGAANVQVVQSTAQSPNLPDSSVDLAIMVDVYHELAYPREMLQALYKALKPQGRLLLLEYRAEDPAIAIKEIHKMSVAQANKEMAANGFVLDRRENDLPIQHFLMYRKR